MMKNTANRCISGHAACLYVPWHVQNSSLPSKHANADKAIEKPGWLINVKAGGVDWPKLTFDRKIRKKTSKR